MYICMVLKIIKLEIETHRNTSGKNTTCKYSINGRDVRCTEHGEWLICLSSIYIQCTHNINIFVIRNWHLDSTETVYIHVNQCTHGIICNLYCNSDFTINQYPFDSILITIAIMLNFDICCITEDILIR